MTSTITFLRYTLTHIILFVSLYGYSINPQPEPTTENSEVVVEKTKKPNAFKKWIIKRITKKLQKKIRAVKGKDKRISRTAKIGLFSGLIAIALLFTGMSFSVWLFAGVFSVLGGIFSINTLNRTNENRVQFKKERRQAIWGLVLSILTGLLLFGLVLFFRLLQGL